MSQEKKEEKKDRMLFLPDRSGDSADEDQDEVFKEMNDRLYCYLVFISKHNPDKIDGEYVEKFSYIYLDKDSNGKYSYDPKETMRRLGMSSATYYRKLKKLKELGLVYEARSQFGRKILKIDFISSKRILNMETCVLLSQIKNEDKKQNNDDILKILSILKILNAGKKRFTLRTLRTNLGYADGTNYENKNWHIRYLLGILTWLELISVEVDQIIDNQSNPSVYYKINWVNDKPNKKTKALQVENVIDSEKTAEILEQIAMFPIF